MIGYWTRFAKKGDPNDESARAWPLYDATSDRNIEFGKAITVKSGLDSKACDLADQFYGFSK
jgi:carboxylesterase type B